MARIDARAVKKLRSCRIDQLAETVFVTPQTVRNWIKEGLPCLMDQKPFLIRRSDIKEFYAANLKARKHPFGRFEVFCRGCGFAEMAGRVNDNGDAATSGDEGAHNDR